MEVNQNSLPADLLDEFRRRGSGTGRPLDVATRARGERLFGVDLGGVRVHSGCDGILDALGARAACRHEHIFLHSRHADGATLLHEAAHAAQWLRFGASGMPTGTVSGTDDACEREAALLASSRAGHAGVAQACSAEILRDVVQQSLMVDCQITGHASPRWRGAKNEQERVAFNDKLSKQRAEAVSKVFERALRTNLRDYSLDFRFNETPINGVPDDTVIIGSLGRGQQDSIIDAKGDKSNDAQKYRRVDLALSVLRRTSEVMPVIVRQKWNRPTKTTIWYVNVGFSAAVAVGPAVTYLMVKLKNWAGQEAVGSIFAAGIGGGVKLSKKIFSLADKAISASVSWSDDAFFATNRDVGFEDFHGVGVRYTNFGVALYVGYSRSYITFYGMGPDAASIYCGGFSTGGDLGAGGYVVNGVLWLHHVPNDYVLEETDETEWEPYKSEWLTNHSLSVYFPDGSADLTKEQSKITKFAADVAKAIRE